MTEAKAFQRPSRIEALFNRLMGKLVAIGLGPGYMRGNCLPLWVDQGDGGVVGSTKD